MKHCQQIIMSRISLEERNLSNNISFRKTLSAKLLILTLIFSNLLIIFPNSSPIYAQRVVTVTADQPNIWTLEQAHYLLAQMHRRNLDLRAKSLSELDANQVDAISIDILKSIMELGATYSEADQFNNSLIKQDKTFDAERRRQLTNDLDDLNKQSLEYTKIIARLTREKALAENDDEKAKIEAKIIENTDIKAGIDGQIDQKNKQLDSLSSSSGSVKDTSSSATFNAAKFPAGIIDDQLKSKLADAINSYISQPKLNASLQLDKFLQLQEEIISKQLTLLRDEVGPGEKLLFLELPQSINATYDKSDDMWAQSRWLIKGFTRCELPINGKSIPCRKILNSSMNERTRNRPPRTSSDLMDGIRDNSEITNSYQLTIFDLTNPKNLPRKLFSVDDSIAANFYTKYVVGLSSLSDINKSTITNYQTKIRNLKIKEKDKEEKEKDVANCANSNCKEDLNRILDQINRDIKEKQVYIDKQSDELISLALQILNDSIISKDRLNTNPELNKRIVSERTRILSKVNLKAEDDVTRELLNRLWIEDLFPEEINNLREDDFPSKFVELGASTATSLQETKDNGLVNIKYDDRRVRTIDIIPRQSSLNINDVKIRNKSSVFNFVASFLFGFGANFNYQQQRERYSQFVQQELYSSGFGKGSREFGWTFTSMPGTDRLLSGQRTTYAIVIVPEEATSIVLDSLGCSFDRTANQPQDFESAKTLYKTKSKNGCTAEKNFFISIPGGGFDSNNDFYVSGLTYQPVEKGKRIVVSIYGNNFSSQIGIMVNGVPLPVSIGLAQNFILDDSIVGGKVQEIFKTEKVRGSFERVDSNQIVAEFELVDSDDHTPVITLVSPGKATDLNSIPNLYINGNRNIKLKDADWMFGQKPKSLMETSDVQLFISDVDNDGKPIKLTALITGKSLNNVLNAFVNGEDIGGNNRGVFGNSNVYRIIFPPPKDEKIYIVLTDRNTNEFFRLSPISNPAKAQKPKDPPSIDKGKLNFTISQPIRVVYNDTDKKKIAYLIVNIKGVGLRQGLNVSAGQLDVVSETEAFITIPDPKPVQTIRLIDIDKNVYAEGVVVIPAELDKPATQTTPTPKPSPSQ